MPRAFHNPENMQYRRENGIHGFGRTFGGAR